MSLESDLHAELSGFSQEVIDLLEAGDFWDLEGTYSPAEFYSHIPKRAREEYKAASDEKNSRVWGIVKAVVIGQAISAGIQQFKKSYPSRPVKPSAQDYMNRYIKERGGEFIKNMGRTDQKKLVDFIWSNAGQHERPLAKQIANQPHLKYVLDQGKHRYETIVRTEKFRATSYGSFQSARDSRFTTKTRVSAGDKRVRPSHRALAGITVPIDDPYPNGETYAGENSINCRCRDRYGNDLKAVDKNAAKTYAENLKAEKDYVRQAAPDTPKAKPIGGAAMPRKVAPRIEPDKVEPKAEPRKVAKLTENEKYSVEHYASDGFLDINKYLRGQKGYRAREEDIKKNVARLDSAIGKSTVPKCTVYRGLENEEMFKNLSSLKGSVIEDKAFVSTSLNKNIGETYGSGSGGITIEIRVPEGAKALDVAGLSPNKMEREILLPRGSKFNVIEAHVENGRGRVIAELVQ